MPILPKVKFHGISFCFYGLPTQNFAPKYNRFLASKVAKRRCQAILHNLGVQNDTNLAQVTQKDVIAKGGAIKNHINNEGFQDNFLCIDRGQKK